MNIYAADADGYRAAWARGGYSKADYMAAKAHWAAMPKHVIAPPPVINKHTCPTCGKITLTPEGEPAPWEQRA